MRHLLLIAALLLAAPALAQAPAHRAEPQASPAQAQPSAAPALPPDSITHHTLELNGRVLHFTATAGSFHVTDAQGHPQADIAYISYTLDDADPRSRPVAFAVNGGPGASSAWLQLGAMGPWRLPLRDKPAPSDASSPVPNPQTWLDFTDLVFIDPPGTGYSRLASSSEELRKRIWSVEGDIPPLAEVMRRWLVRQGRIASPHFIVGESYGGFRGPRLVRALQTGQGVAVAGAVLISPVLDFASRARGTDPMTLVARLPSMAAIAAEDAGKPVDLAAVESYATGEFLQDLLRGPRDAAAVDRLTAQVAALTGLPPGLVHRRAGRVDLGTFLRRRVPREVASPYDGTIAAPDATPHAPWSNQPDPVLDALRAPFTSGMLALYQRLGWQPEGHYEVLNDAVSRAWDWGHGLQRPQSVGALRDALALDPAFRVLVVHGHDDLVTPYFATKLLLAQLPVIGAPGRVRLDVLPGGHMVYLRDASRAALHDAAQALAEPPGGEDPAAPAQRQGK